MVDAAVLHGLKEIIWLFSKAARSSYIEMDHDKTVWGCGSARE